MQHLCSRCGAAVDNSLPYCPGCEAPQVRFVPREPGEETVQLRAAVAPAPVLMPSPASLPYPAAETTDLARFLRAAVYAGAIGFVLCLIPFGPLIGMPLAGWLAVRFYSRSAPLLPTPPGFRLGALAGLAAFGMLATMVSLSVALSTREQLRKTLLDVAERAHSFNPDLSPEQFVSNLMTPAGAITSAVFLCILFVVLAGLGGLVSASISRRRGPN